MKFLAWDDQNSNSALTAHDKKNKTCHNSKLNCHWKKEKQERMCDKNDPETNEHYRYLMKCNKYNQQRKRMKKNTEKTLEE